MRSAAAYSADMYGVACSAKVAWSATGRQGTRLHGDLAYSGVENRISPL